VFGKPLEPAPDVLLREAVGEPPVRAAPTFELIPQEPSPRSPKSASLWRLENLCDVGEPLRQGDQVRRGLVRRRPSGRKLLLVSLPCCGPFARQGGQSGDCAIGPLPLGSEIAVQPLVIRLQRGDVRAQLIHKFRAWEFAGLFARLFSGRTHNNCGDQHPCSSVISWLSPPAAAHGPCANRRW
jgi:hypothetical protein